MALDDDIRVLERVDLFDGLTREQYRLLAFGAERLALRPGQVLYREGDAADCGYAIVSGQVDLIVHGSRGPLLVQSATPGMLLGETAMLTAAQRPTAAVANGDAEVMRVTRALFRRMLEEYPDVAFNLHRRLTERFEAMLDALERLGPRFAG